MKDTATKTSVPTRPDTPDCRPEICELTVAELLERFPGTVPVFIRHRMACPGCLMSCFERIREAALNYGLDVESLVAELKAAMDAEEKTP